MLLVSKPIATLKNMLHKLKYYFMRTKVNKPNIKEIEGIIFENKKLKSALEVGQIGVWDYNILKNETIYSEESSKMLGIEPQELRNNPELWNDLVHPEDRHEYFESFNKHLEQKKSIYENISRLKNKNGKYQWILDKGKVLEWSDNKTPKRLIGVHIDITDAKIKDEKISQSIKLITEQNKKLKNFAHIASHNLKEHAGNFESLLKLYKDAETDEEKQEIIELIDSVSKSLNSTIQNLRDIVSIESKKNDEIKIIKVKSFVDECIENLQARIKHQKAIINNNLDADLTIEFNYLYLESIVQNLLTNAIKYKHPDRDPVIDINGNNKFNLIQLCFQDNGVGVDLDTHGKAIFGLYKTFHKNDDAEGVGLYITKNQIESLGGTISVESEVNKGSRFILEFKK